jgi:SWI/SNF-related matrix-associated actin-dependent regulator 1 of chromatin subfamily A
MVISNKKRKEAEGILKTYNGKNSEILRLQRKSNLKDLDCEYVLMNHMKTQPILIDKVVKIADFYGQKLQKDFQLEFIPEKIHVYTLAGETSIIYHVWCKHSRNQTNWISLFIPKKALLTPLIEIDWDNYPLDVDNINRLLGKGGRQLKNHQSGAARFLLASKKCILADDMGLGKSLSALSASYGGMFQKILIICPASLKTTWSKEISFFGETSISIIQGTDKDKWDMSKKYTILNYDIFDKHGHEVAYRDVVDEFTGKIKKVRSTDKKLIAELTSKNPLMLADFDLVIMDEAHKLSNSTSNRYKAIRDFLQKSFIDNVYLLTGTPVSNNTKNLYNILSLIGSGIVADYDYFMVRYCGAKKRKLKGGREILLPSGDTNIEELQERIKNIYLRRLKSELKDLPDKIIKELYYELTPKEQLEYNQVYDEYRRNKYEDASTTLIDEKYQSFTDENHRQLVEGTLLRQWLSNAMIPRTIELCNDCWDNDPECKIIIACCYDNELYELQKYFGNKCVIYNGKMSQKEKDKSKDEFTDNPKIKVFIGNIQSAGVGLTLTSANVCIFNNYDWVPGNNSQFYDRIHRISQTKDCLIYFQLFSDTYSEYVWNTLVRKLLTIETVIIDEKNK